MEIKAIKTSIFKEKESLEGFIKKHVKKLREGDILVVTSKIVSLAEGRIKTFESEKERDECIKSESELALRPSKRWFTICAGMLTTIAGIDESNAGGKSILLPKNSFATAGKILKFLKKSYGVKKVGVIVVDSRSIVMRRGIVGEAIGYTGFKGLGDERGKKDLFGRKIKYARANVADSLAGASVLLMGESNQGTPLAIVSGAPVQFVSRVKKDELLVPLAEDKFTPFWKEVVKRKLI